MKVIIYTLCFILSFFVKSVTSEVLVDTGELDDGSIIIVDWHGYPIIVVKRDKGVAEAQKITVSKTKDDYLMNVKKSAMRFGNDIATHFYNSQNVDLKTFRSLDVSLGVYFAISNITGCRLIVYKGRVKDPCNNSYYDSFGRGVKYGDSLLIPEYYVVNHAVNIVDGILPVDIVDFTPDIWNMEILDGEKAILFVRWKQYEQLKKLLIKSPNSMNYQDNFGVSPLHLIAGQNKVYLFEEFSCKMKFDLLTNNNDTPLSIAIKMNAKQTIDLLKVWQNDSHDRICEGKERPR